MTAYGVNKWAVILVIVMPTILYAPVNFSAAWFYNNWKIRSILSMAAGLQIVGAWIRTFALVGEEKYFWPLALGSFVFFLATPFILNSISVISNLWFADNERAKATAISGLMAPVGSLLGLAMTGVLASGVDKEDSKDCYDRFVKIVYVQNVVFTVLGVLFLILFRDKPEKPPSKLSLTFR